MKTCKTCLSDKTLEDFYKNNSTRDGRGSSCKECVKQRAKLNRKKRNPTRKSKPKKTRLQGFRKLPKDNRKCAECEEVKNKDKFYVDNNRASGTSVYCKSCYLIRRKRRRQELGDKALDTRRKWAKENRERLRKQDESYRKSNRDARRVAEAKRRARKNDLPNTLTLDEVDEILKSFNGRCAICDEPSEALDHFIPIASGCGGTTKENIIPLCRRMNSSKLDRNPFDWAETYLEEEQKNRFKELVKYLSDLNGLSVEEYREFVFSCFKNKNIS